jgi:hypothetical protein
LALGEPVPSTIQVDLGRWRCAEESRAAAAAPRKPLPTLIAGCMYVSVCVCMCMYCMYVYVLHVCVCMCLYGHKMLYIHCFCHICHSPSGSVAHTVTYAPDGGCSSPERVSGVFVEFSTCFCCSIQCRESRLWEKFHLFAVPMTKNTYIHIYTHTYIYIHIHGYTYRYGPIHTLYILICTAKTLYVYVYACIGMYAVHMHVSVRICMYLYVSVCICLYCIY